MPTPSLIEKKASQNRLYVKIIILTSCSPFQKKQKTPIYNCYLKHMTIWGTVFAKSPQITVLLLPYEQKQPFTNEIW